MAEPERQRLRSNLELSEECIREIVSLLNPKEWGRGCAVSRKFREASESDENWVRFLPPDWMAIISRSSAHLHFTSLKQLYLDLSDDPILIDGDTKSFFLDKSSGKKCYLLPVRELSIICCDYPQYWRWISLTEESRKSNRFPEVALLHDVWWFDIRGKMSTSILSPKTRYVAYLVYKLWSGARGFDGPPFKASVGTIGGEVYKQIVRLGLFLMEPNQQHRIILPPQQHTSHPKQRIDGWLEIELGQFFNGGGEDDKLQIKANTQKIGLILKGIKTRPQRVSTQTSIAGSSGVGRYGKGVGAGKSIGTGARKGRAENIEGQ
ncbi:F-box protein PP2-B10-like [Quercus lobata]|uniref:F-box protein PP2-B10-like n=1 Tax=Quercus lobata TaxID=97700 RepID=UPI001246359A|nr:F-box protein PP2-B10-like [Quercus lobata]